MGAIILQILRPVVIWCVQAGLSAIVFSILEKILDALQEWIRDAFSISDTDSKAVIANYMVDAIAFVGAGAAVIYSKAPISLAKKIGLGNRTATKVKVPDAVTAKVESVVVTEAAKASFLSKLKSYVVGNSPTDLLMRLMLLQQMGDWYFFKNSMVVDLFKSVFGDSIVDKDAWMKSPGPFSVKEFDNYVRAIEAQNPLGLEYPVGSFLYSRETLAKLVSWVYGKILSEGGTATATSLPPKVAPYIIFGNKSSTPVTTTTPPAQTSQATTTAKVTVFTGVVSQGTLGNGVVFSPRTNEMIDDVNELVTSASVNLANFLTALPSRVIYEIKIVSSITTKDGFTQRGGVNKVQIGTYSNGQPKYKTVTNKFAVLYLYLLTDKGTKTKIATINVGPVNAINFQVTSNDLTAVADRLKGVVTTSNVSEIKTIVSDTPIVVTPTPAPVLPLPNYNISAKIPNDLGYAFYKRPSDGSNPTSYQVVPNYKFWNPEYSQITEEEYRRATGDTKDYTNSGYQIVNGAFTLMTTYKSSDQNPPATQSQLAQANLPWSGSLQATSIAYFYDPEGKKYPSVAERSLLYEKYGLGAASLYIGSTEQNIQLLAKLKGF